MHLSFDRKISELTRRSDITVANSTESGWMMQVAALARPLDVRVGRGTAG
jgi:hypothetical protein